MKKITQKLVLFCMLALAITSYAQKKIAFIGQRGTYNGALPNLDDRPQGEGDSVAGTWFMEDFGVNTPNVTGNYLSFEDVAAGANLSQYNAIWIQYDPETWAGRLTDFPRSRPEGDGTKHSILKETGFDWGRDEATDDPLENAFVTAIKTYYEAGGNMLLGNFASAGIEPFGVINPALSSPWELKPNQDFGGIDVDASFTDGAWGNWWNGGSNSSLISGINTSTFCNTDNLPFIEFLSSGTEKKNRVYQYNLDWGRIANDNPGADLATKRSAFENLLQAKILLQNCEGNEIQGVEFNPTGFNAGKGTVITYGAGTYDWYVGSNGNNNNVKNLTKNTLLYLANKSDILTTNGSVTQSQCGGSYTWPVNNVTYTASATEVITVGNNTATLNLTISEPTTNGNVTQEQTGGTYTWAENGTTYAASGIYTHVVGCNTATLNLTIYPDGHKKIAFIGQRGTYNGTLPDLDGKPQGEGDLVAGTWFMQDFGVNTPNVTANYLSFEDVAAGANLSQYDAIWIQYDPETWAGRLTDFPRSTADWNRIDGDVRHSMLKESGWDWGRDQATDGPLEDAFVNAIRTYYQAGGNMLLGNFAGAGIEPFGVIDPALSSPWELKPNNGWGGIDVEQGFTGDAWGNWWNGGSDSTLISGMSTSVNDCNVNLPFIEFLSSGTEKKNRVLQYNLDWGRIADYTPGADLATKRNNFENLLQAKILLQSCNGNEIQGVEFKPTGFNTGKGTVIIYGAGSYDWHVGPNGNNNNVKNLTKNSLLYLAKKNDVLTTNGSVTQSQCGGSYTWPVNNETYTASATEVVTVGNNTATLNLTIVPAPNAGTDGTLNVATGVIPTNSQLFAALTGADAGGTWSNSGLVYTYTVAATSPCTGSDTATVTVSESIPASFSVCKGATLASLIGTSSLKFYAKIGDTSPLPGSTPLTVTKSYFVTQTVNNVESSRSSRVVTVNELPTVPSGLVLTNGLEVIKKVGNFIGTSTELKLTATAATGTVATATYNWTLPKTPTGVSQKVGEATNGAEITVNFAGVTAANTAIDFLVSSVSAAGCFSKTAKKLTVTRSEPGKPKALVLTDALLSGVLKITKLDPYTGALKSTRALTLTATEETKAGSQASSYKWVLPAGVTTTATPFEDNSVAVANTYTSTLPTIDITLGGITNETTFLFKVYGVNGNGTSSLFKDLTCTSAAPKKPGKITTETGAKPTYGTTCNNSVKVEVPSVLGATYAWSVDGGATISSGQGSNSIVINTASASATLTISVTASNGSGPSLPSILALKQTACVGGRIAPESLIADEFRVFAYPNPSSSEFTIEASGKGATNVQIYDMTGRLIENRQSNSNSVQVGRNFASGVYNVIVNQGTKAKSLRVIKK